MTAQELIDLLRRQARSLGVPLSEAQVRYVSFQQGYPVGYCIEPHQMCSDDTPDGPYILLLEGAESPEV